MWCVVQAIFWSFVFQLEFYEIVAGIKDKIERGKRDQEEDSELYNCVARLAMFLLYLENPV